MKSTYKLFGAFWDGKPIPNSPPNVESIGLAHESAIPITAILRMDDESKIEEIRQSVVEIEIDYFPNCSSALIEDFFLRRLLQITEFFDARIVCKETNVRINVSRLIKKLYKKKNIA
jgi:hypothetical protein